jgi:opacity protein-like surface antigen
MIFILSSETLAKNTIAENSSENKKSNFSWFTGFRTGYSFLDGFLKPRLIGADGTGPLIFTTHLDLETSGIEGEAFLGVKKEMRGYQYIGEIGLIADNIRFEKSRFQMHPDKAGYTDISNLYYSFQRQFSGSVALGIGTALSENIDIYLKFKILLSRFKISFKSLDIPNVYGYKTIHEVGFAPGAQLSYKISNHLSLNLNYSYTLYPTLKASELFKAPAPALVLYSGTSNPQYHSVTIGATYHF